MIYGAIALAPHLCYNIAMKLQFSLATLLACMTVLAVVCAAAVGIPIRESGVSRMRAGLSPNGVAIFTFKDTGAFDRSPNGEEIACRNLIWGPPAIAGAFGVLWLIRRLKSRRESRPPVE